MPVPDARSRLQAARRRPPAVVSQSLQQRGIAWHARCNIAANAAVVPHGLRVAMKKYLICPREAREGRQWLVIGHGETLATFQEREFAWNVATDLAGDLLHLTGEESVVELTDGYFTMRSLEVRPGIALPRTGLAQRSSLA